MEDIKKKRAVNFTADEKMLLFNIITDFKDVIELKKTDATTWKDKDLAWNKITLIFNSKSPNIYARTKESLKKFYDNKKKEIRKIVANERIERVKTGGGIPDVIKEDPVKDIALGIMNTKTVTGLQSKFDGDSCFPKASTSKYMNTKLQNQQCTSEEMILISTYLNESNEDKEDPTSQQLHFEELGIPIEINQSENSELQLNWGDYKPGHLKSPLHTKLSSVISKNKNSEDWTKRRRPGTVALHSSELSKNYLQVATVKLELLKLQLQVFKSDTKTRRKREAVEFELKKQISETELAIQKQTLKNMN